MAAAVGGLRVQGVKVSGRQLALRRAEAAFTTGNVRALIPRIRFWGMLYSNYGKEPQIGIGNYVSSYITGV